MGESKVVKAIKLLKENNYIIVEDKSRDMKDEYSNLVGMNKEEAIRQLELDGFSQTDSLTDTNDSRSYVICFSDANHNWVSLEIESTTDVVIDIY